MRRSRGAVARSPIPILLVGIPARRLRPVLPTSKRPFKALIPQQASVPAAADRGPSLPGLSTVSVTLRSELCPPVTPRLCNENIECA